MRPQRAVPLFSVVSMAACLVTDPVDFQQQAPVSPPVIRDILGLTSPCTGTCPRLGSITVLQSTDGPSVTFTVPVDSQATDQTLWYQWFYNEPRDCVELDGGSSCNPIYPYLSVTETGAVERVITQQFPFTTPGCYKIELWVSTAGFARSGDFHTPLRPGDFDFATWWVIREPAPPTAPIDVSTCQINPTQLPPS